MDYDKIKIFKRQELQANGKKVRLAAQVKELGNGLLVCKKLISVHKTEGLTTQQEKKFKIEDYK